MRNTCGGEIIEVQGGHIVRSTGRKDRHSKVCTAKGPRDSRVRLSANTAIQFYDVQDRLGYDRPSKVVDWLIKKAKASIDNLAKLPPWHPTSGTNQVNFNTSSGGEGWSDQQSDIHKYQRLMAWNTAGGDTAGGSRFMCNSLPPPLSQPSLQQFFGHSGQYFTQRGPLQSSNTSSSVRSWIDQPISNHDQTLSDHSSTLTGIDHFQTPSAFSGFQIPTRILADNKEQDGNRNNSSSAYSDSLH